MAYLSDFTKKEAYGNQVEISGIESIIHEDTANQATYGNHCELSNTKIVAVYNDVTNNKGMVRVGDRVSDFCIEWGEPLEFYNGSCKHIIPIRVSDTKFAIVYVQASDDDGYIIAGTISNTIPTIGTPIEFKDASTCIPIGAELWSDDKVLIAYANGTTNGQCRVVDTSNINTLVLGTEATFKATTDISAYTTLKQVCIHSPTLATVVYRVSNTATKCQCLTLSGSTITPSGSETTFGGTADIQYPKIGCLSSTTFVLAYLDVTATNFGNCQIGTISGTSITAGANEYSFQAVDLPTRRHSIVVIDGTKYAIIYSDGTTGQFACVATVNGTTISYSNASNIGTGSNGYYYGESFNGTTNLTYTKSNQLTFSWLNRYNNQFICGMLEIQTHAIIPKAMCKRVVTVGLNEQIEISSVYLKSNSRGFKMNSSFVTAITGSLYLDGTMSNNMFYSTSDEGEGMGYYTYERECAKVLLGNNPIILKSGQSLYASINTNQSSHSGKGSCTVFGVKRVVV